MKNIKKEMLLIAIALVCGVQTGFSQIIVKVKPARPKYVRVAAPSPRHIWVNEEWEPRGNSYAFVGGHWVEPVRAKATWAPGHWREKKKQGWVWVPGHWR